jgi:hypothetical protein
MWEEISTDLSEHLKQPNILHLKPSETNAIIRSSLRQENTYKDLVTSIEKWK